MIAGKLKQIAAAEQIRAAVADVRDAEFFAVDPHRRKSGAHAVLFGVLFGGLENISVGQMHGGRKAFCPLAQMRIYLAEDLILRSAFVVEAVFHHRFYSQFAGDFAVGFASHAVGKYKEVQRRNDLEAIFVVGTHATEIGHAAACDSHTNSHCGPEITPVPTPVASDSAPTLTEAQGLWKGCEPY